MAKQCDKTGELPGLKPALRKRGPTPTGKALTSAERQARHRARLLQASKRASLAIDRVIRGDTSPAALFWVAGWSRKAGWRK